MFLEPGGTWSDAGHSSCTGAGTGTGTGTGAGNTGCSRTWTWTGARPNGCSRTGAWTNGCSRTGAWTNGCSRTGAWTCTGPDCGQKMMMSTMSHIWLRPLTIGTVLITGSDSIWAASKLGSSTPTRFLRIIRKRNSWMAHTTRIGWCLLLLPLGWIQTENVEQDSGDICHHDEGNEHDEPR